MDSFIVIIIAIFTIFTRFLNLWDICCSWIRKRLQLKNKVGCECCFSHNAWGYATCKGKSERLGSNSPPPHFQINLLYPLLYSHSFQLKSLLIISPTTLFASPYVCVSVCVYVFVWGGGLSCFNNCQPTSLSKLVIQVPSRLPYSGPVPCRSLWLLRAGQCSSMRPLVSASILLFCPFCCHHSCCPGVIPS